jgi:hypothetical protein
MPLGSFGKLSELIIGYTACSLARLTLSMRERERGFLNDVADPLSSATFQRAGSPQL